jgi:hypothetical protein
MSVSSVETAFRERVEGPRAVHRFQFYVGHCNDCSYIQVSQEWTQKKFKLHQSDEDIHTAIERRLKVYKLNCKRIILTN